MLRSPRGGRPLAAALAALAFGAVLLGPLAGCSKDGDAADGTPATDADAIQYSLGAPITDSTIVAIVTSEYGTDTLRTNLFQNQAGYLMQSNPIAMMDTTQGRELRRSLVEGFVLQHLIRNEAERATDLAVSPARVDSQIAQLKMGPGPDGQPRQMTDAEFQQQLAAEGYTLDSVRTILTNQLRQETLARRWGDAAATPTAAEIADFRRKQAEEIRVSHIILQTPPGTPEARRDSARRAAQAVLDSVKRGGDFAGLARRHSQDGSAATGGDLNFFNRSAPLDLTFKRAAFALRDSGDVTDDLVQTMFGYHIIKLTGRREGTPVDSAQARLALVDRAQRKTIRERLKALVGERDVTVRVNPAVFRADLNAPLDLGEDDF